MLILGPSLRESMKDIIDIFFNVKRADICKRFGYFNKLNESVYTYLYFLCVIKPKNIQMLDFVILMITHNMNFLSESFYCYTGMNPPVLLTNYSHSDHKGFSNNQNHLINKILINMDLVCLNNFWISPSPCPALTVSTSQKHGFYLPST